MKVLLFCVTFKLKKDKAEIRFDYGGRNRLGGECVTSVVCFPCCVGVHYDRYFGVNIF
jgi:hypothetical protein